MVPGGRSNSSPTCSVSHRAGEAAPAKLPTSTVATPRSHRPGADRHGARTPGPASASPAAGRSTAACRGSGPRRLRILLGVGDPRSRGHQIELARPDELFGSQAVPVEGRTGEQPGHRLQAEVRMGAARTGRRPGRTWSGPCGPRSTRARRSVGPGWAAPDAREGSRPGRTSLGDLDPDPKAGRSGPACRSDVFSARDPPDRDVVDRAPSTDGDSPGEAGRASPAAQPGEGPPVRATRPWAPGSSGPSGRPPRSGSTSSTATITRSR